MFGFETRSYSVIQDDLELTRLELMLSLLYQPPKCSDYRQEQPCLTKDFFLGVREGEARSHYVSLVGLKLAV